MIILIPLSAFIIALKAQGSNLCNGTCYSWEVCVEVNATTGICEWADCANTGEFDAYCQREDGPEYICEINTYFDGSSYAYCGRQTCSTDAECSNIGNSGEYVCDDEYYGECRLPCSPTADTCSSWEICNDNGRCESKTCGNFYNGTAYCQSDYGPEYACEHYGDGDYGCSQVDCNVTADCAAALGIGFVCDEYWGNCEEGCVNDLFCEEKYMYYSNPYVCDLETSLCVETCNSTSDCGYSEICSEIGLCERVPYCVADPSQCDFYGALFGYQAVCNEVTGDCEEVECDNDNDCSLGEYSTCSPAGGICIDACQSDMECQEKYDLLPFPYFNSSRAYCVDNLLICREAYMTCDTSFDCYEGEICQDGLCKLSACTMDSQCDAGSYCVIPPWSDYGVCQESECSVDAECADMYNDTFICIVGVIPYYPDELGFCINEVCKEGTCGERGECIVGYFGDDPPPENLTIPDDIGSCVASECTMDEDCMYGICVMVTIPELDAEIGLCSYDLCKAGTCFYGECYPGFFPYDPYPDDWTIAAEVGTCADPECSEETELADCGEGSVCVVRNDMYMPEGTGYCMENECSMDADCVDLYNDTYICIIGIVPYLPDNVGFCDNYACKDGTCGERGDCIEGYFGDDVPPDNYTIPDDIGTCFESQCTSAEDCDGDNAICLETSIGNVCNIGCDTEGAVCTDEDGEPAVCRLIPKDTYFCGTPETDLLRCQQDEVPEPAYDCTTPSPVEPSDTTDAASRVVLFGALSVIAGALTAL